MFKTTDQISTIVSVCHPEMEFQMYCMNACCMNDILGLHQFQFNFYEDKIFYQW